ncbi:MAG: carboxylating nicotinate-nucleotide diphosphorylase [Candidatus Peregrinibacteria bacterium]
MLPHDRSHLLTVKNPWYTKIVLDFFAQELIHDGEDITTNILGASAEKMVIATITAKSSGILAGKEEADIVLSHFFPGVGCDWGNNMDGKALQKGDILCTFTGSAKEVLKLERPLLNMLMRMSGIATQTNRFQNVSILPLAATRKTLWGPLDKKAVSVGGGITHRLGLFDAVLLKENHLALLSAEEKIQNMLKKTPFAAFFEVEVETEEEFWKVYQIFQDARMEMPKVIMFDNFSPGEIQRITEKIPKDERFRDNIFWEASGGITEKTLKEYERCGVDVLSLSALTMGGETVDLSLRIGA